MQRTDTRVGRQSARPRVRERARARRAPGRQPLREHALAGRLGLHIAHARTGTHCAPSATPHLCHCDRLYRCHQCHRFLLCTPLTRLTAVAAVTALTGLGFCDGHRWRSCALCCRNYHPDRSADADGENPRHSESSSKQAPSY